MAYQGAEPYLGAHQEVGPYLGPRQEVGPYLGPRQEVGPYLEPRQEAVLFQAVAAEELFQRVVVEVPCQLVVVEAFYRLAREVAPEVEHAFAQVLEVWPQVVEHDVAEELDQELAALHLVAVAVAH